MSRFYWWNFLQFYALLVFLVMKNPKSLWNGYHSFACEELVNCSHLKTLLALKSSPILSFFVVKNFSKESSIVIFSSLEIYTWMNYGCWWEEKSSLEKGAFSPWCFLYKFPTLRKFWPCLFLHNVIPSTDSQHFEFFMMSRGNMFGNEKWCISSVTFLCKLLNT